MMLYTHQDPAGYWDDAPEPETCTVPRCGRDVPEPDDQGPFHDAFGNPACEEHRYRDWVVVIHPHGEVTEEDLESDPRGVLRCAVCGWIVTARALREYAKKQRA